MAKINQEEYKVLKELDDKWKWIARIEEGAMKTFISKPFKNMDFGRSGSWDIKGNENHAIYTTYSDLFQFIQWEDEEPHNIAELIKEYEIETGMRYDFGKIKVVDIDTSKIATRNGYVYVKESEESEMKKDIEWLKNKINDTLNFGIFGPSDDVEIGYQTAMKEVLKLIDELDEQQKLPPLMPDFSEKGKKERLEKRREVEKIIKSLKKKHGN